MAAFLEGSRGESKRKVKIMIGEREKKEEKRDKRRLKKMQKN